MTSRISALTHTNHNSHSGLANASQESELARVLDSYLAAVEKGDLVDPEVLMARHPAIAERLRSCLHVLRLASQVEARTDADSAVAMSGVVTQLGDFRIIRMIGRGGMGVVFEAEEISLRRKVALKMLPFAAALDPQQLRRFEIEAQATARLHHTNIVPIFSVGCERGVHFYAMQFIEGQTLAAIIRDLRGSSRIEPISVNDPTIPWPAMNSAAPDSSLEPRSVDEATGAEHSLAADIITGRFAPSAGSGPPSKTGIHSQAFFRTVAHLGQQAAEGLDYAHRLGIIHRDIKPANLLVDVRGNLWITDFGLARMQADSSLTMTGDILGTLRYTSPEQASPQRGVVDHRTDVYSLGSTLYELLTLHPVYDAQDRTALLHQMAFEEPKPLRFWNRAVPRDLETIVRKALAKDVQNRYASARELADDLRRFLDHRPIKARRPPLAERATKWARRHQPLVALMLLILILVAAGLVTSAVLIRRERAEAVRQRDRARRHDYATDMRTAYELLDAGKAPSVAPLLAKWRPDPGGSDERDFAWHYLRRQCHDERRTLRGHAGAVYQAKFSADGRSIVSCGQDGTVRFWDVATGRPLRVIAAHAAEVNGIAFSPDGHTLATVGDDGAIKLWNAETGVARATIAAHKGDAISIHFTSDGQRLISAGRKDCLVKLWNATTLEELASTRAHDRDLESVVLSPDGATLATAGADGYARLWKTADLSPQRSLHTRHCIYGLSFSADGTLLATTGAGGAVQMWDVATGEPVEWGQGLGYLDDAQAVSFLSDDRVIVSASGHAVLRLSDAATGRLLANLNGHTGKIWGISASPDGTTFATVSSDGTVKLWDARGPQRWLAIPLPLDTHGQKHAFTPDAQTLVVAWAAGGKWVAPINTGPYGEAADLEVSGFDTKTGATQFHHILERGRRTHGPGLTTDGAIVLLGRTEVGTTTVWEAATGRQLATVDASHLFTGSRFVHVHRKGQPIEALDAFTGMVRALKGTEAFRARAADPDAKVVVLTARDDPADDRMAVWSHTTNGIKATRRGAGSYRHAATLSPDATILATGEMSLPGLIQLWDVKTLEPCDRLAGHRDVVCALEFSPDGETLASMAGKLVKLWDVETRVEMLTLRGPFEPLPPLRFSPDGRTLAFRADADGKPLVYLIRTEVSEDLIGEEDLLVHK